MPCYNEPCDKENIYYRNILPVFLQNNGPRPIQMKGIFIGYNVNNVILLTVVFCFVLFLEV